jgi:hypothetical protein
MRLLLSILLLFSTILSFGQNQSSKLLLTKFETSNYLETDNYSATFDLCKSLEKASNKIKIINIGESTRGKEIPMLILDKNGFNSPINIKKAGRAIVLIQACVHSGEPDGKDAGIILLRNLALKNLNPTILNNLSILFIPIFNVDGLERWGEFNRINQNGPKEMGWRTTAANYNLNRDYVKADAKEMQNWLKMYNYWDPDFVFDCHTTDGADYQYAITYSLETNGNLDSNLTNWISSKYINQIKTKMDSLNFPIFPYVMFKNWHDPRSGLLNYVSPLKLLNGFTASRNRICMLIETHMLKAYKTRVFSTYQLLLESLKLIASQKNELLKLNKDADDYTASKQFSKNPFIVKYTMTGDSEMVDFKGVHYDIVKSDITHANWFIYDSTRKEIFSTPYYKKIKSQEIVTLPAAYIIPPEYAIFESILNQHKVQFFKLRDDVTIVGNITKFNSVKLSTTSVEGRQTVVNQTSTNSNNEVIVPKGSIVIPIYQKRAKLIAHMFEPKSSDSFLQWGYFNIIFEQKEYSESYVMEKMMREMMAKDPNLKIEFDKKCSSDTLFSQDPEEIYNWFYSKTPYWDQKLNIYPIIRVLDDKTLDTLIYHKRQNIK